ncbi:thiamine phosphate synthase [Roseomonas terrae]|uniref:Thiamine phosphate synthase n=2 Tax=Neoroseomonas terrae TaxID=424799 RepID=A0ABS5EN12_9PROT|nr:thiamine phosphate synthase [Neoroseomonas terrae]
MAAQARRLAPGLRHGRPLPALWLVTDPLRLPDPLPAARRLPRGSGVLARSVEAGVLRRLSSLARRRRLVLLVAGDGRSALAAGAGLHLPDRRMTRGLLPFLRARRAGAPHALLTVAAHGGAAAAARTRRLRPDLAFLSPIFATRSHPGATALGPLRWMALARRLGVPAAALGGVSAATAPRVPRRAAGLAAIDGLAPQAVAHPPQCLS